jgi:hypothetical protein
LDITKPDLSDFKNKLNNFLDINITDENESNINTEITFEQIFSILGELNEYNIDLFLLDYSCSVFPFKITKEEYVKLLKETKNQTNNLCSLGGKRTKKRKTLKRKTFKRKTIKRKTIKRKTIKRKTFKRKTLKRKTLKRKH